LTHYDLAGIHRVGTVIANGGTVTRGGPSIVGNEEIFLPSAAHGDRPLVPAARHYVPVPMCFVRKRGLIPVGSLASQQLTPGWKDGARSAERFVSYPDRIKPGSATPGTGSEGAGTRLTNTAEGKTGQRKPGRRIRESGQSWRSGCLVLPLTVPQRGPQHDRDIHDVSHSRHGGNVIDVRCSSGRYHYLKKRNSSRIGAAHGDWLRRGRDPPHEHR